MTVAQTIPCPHCSDPAHLTHTRLMEVGASLIYLCATCDHETLKYSKTRPRVKL